MLTMPWGMRLAQRTGYIRHHLTELAEASLIKLTPI
jgi:hypothetical protein